jgi:hypothetical protein
MKRKHSPRSSKVAKTAKATKATKATKASKTKAAKTKPTQTTKCALKQVEKQASSQVLHTTDSTLDEIEAARTNARLARLKETKKRNADAQSLPRSKKLTPQVSSKAHDDLNADQKGTIVLF